MPIYTDANEKKLAVDSTHQVEKFRNDDDKSVNDENDSKVGDMEIACQEDTNQSNVEEGNKEAVEQYRHSLWKWPSGRSKLTKVTM